MSAAIDRIDGAREKLTFHVYGDGLRSAGFAQ